jgi:hypothetical protein
VSMAIGQAAQRAGWRPLPGQSVGLRPDNNFIWSDRNRNGAMDSEEISYYATPSPEATWLPEWAPEQFSGGVAADDLSLYFTAVHAGRAHHFHLPVARWTENGVPIYDPDRAELLVTSPYMGEAAWVSPEGHLLTYGNIKGNFANRDPLVMYRPDGSIAWTYPNPYGGVHGSHTAPKEKRGEIIGPLGVIGVVELTEVGSVFALHTNVGTAELMTSDGLYLARLFRDGRSAPKSWPHPPRRGDSLRHLSNRGEWFGGQLFQRPDGRIFVICSRDAGTIAEVTGLETVRRLATQTLTFTPEQYDLAQAAAQADTETEPPALQIAALTATTQPPALHEFSWQDKASATWRYDETRGAQASWGYDDEYLYVAFQVEDQTPMVNAGEDPQQLFKFGDAALLELRTDPAQTSPTAAPGDLRLLFTVHQGQPLAVLYDYRRPGAGETIELVSVKTTRIEHFTVLAQARVALERAATGYTLRAAVPLAALRWTPEPGVTYPGDFGIVYSDRTGQINELRMHWANRATGIVSDLSLEADIQPALWGRFAIPSNGK